MCADKELVPTLIIVSFIHTMECHKMVPKRCSGIQPMILKDEELDPNVKTVTIPSIEKKKHYHLLDNHAS